jgi:DNA-binding NtrC family response regulator
MAVRVLIVDDEDEFREALAAQLGAQGFAVTAVASESNAERTLRETDVDVVLMDVLMPVAGGLEALQAVQRLRPLSQVIFLTGHADVSTAIDAMERGASDYLLKPIRLDELTEKLVSACETRRLNEQLRGEQPPPT